MQDKKMRDERRERILTQARRLFAANGLNATKISDIAAGVGMSQGLLYHYFSSKEEIFIEIIREAFEKMTTAANALEASPAPPGVKVKHALTQLMRDIGENNDFACTVLLIAQAGLSTGIPAEARHILQQQSGIPYAVMARILRAGQQEGTIKLHDAEMLSMLFWTTIKGLALHKAVSGAAYQSPDVAIVESMFFQQENNHEH